MAVVIKKGNVFDSDANIICHQVNCQGVMGSGVAKEVSERYPVAYEYYKRLCDKYKDHTDALLGDAQIVPADDAFSRYIANCFGQDRYGYDGGQYTSVEALKIAFTNVADVARKTHLKVAMPYKIGCCRGGADWNEVQKIIEDVFQGVDVELWRLEEK